MYDVYVANNYKIKTIALIDHLSAVLRISKEIVGMNFLYTNFYCD